MNKNDLVNLISEELGKTKKDVRLILDALFNKVTLSLQNDEKVIIKDFGTFTKNTTKPFNINSPYDGKLIKNVVQTRVHFKSSPNLIKQIKK